MLSIQGQESHDSNMEGLTPFELYTEERAPSNEKRDRDPAEIHNCGAEREADS